MGRLLSKHLWSEPIPCCCRLYDFSLPPLAPNAGFFIRNVLLCGSKFDHQVVPNTGGVLLLSSVAVLVSFGMQFSLAYYLWAYLPFHPRDNEQNLSPDPPPLGGVWAPNLSGQPEYSVCRTSPVVQVVCIGLFLFYMLNSVPGILKNALIVLWSYKFISEDTNGVLRIHYWRSCSFWAGLASVVRKPFALEKINRQVLESFQYDSEYNSRNVFFLPLSTSLYPYTLDLPPYLTSVELPVELPEGSDWVVKPGAKDSEAKDEYDTTDTRLHYELWETRDFLRRKLAAINPETFALDSDDVDLQEEEEEEDLMATVEPSGWKQGNPDMSIEEAIKEQRRKIEDALVERLDEKTRENIQDLQATLDDLEEEAEQAKVDEHNTKIDQTRDAAEYLVCLDYCDGTSKEEVDRIQRGYYAMFLSAVAFIFGVLPDIATTVMILICGIEYILWSGSKIGSDTNGIEEIVLASLAIVFINDIDEAVYDHALPELYKTAHERDRFGLENWIPAEEPAEMENEETEQFSWWPQPKKQPDPQMKDGHWSHEEEVHGETGYYSKAAFQWCMHLSDETLKHMDNEKHSDPCFCRQYPFLYARKYRYFFQQHFFEGLVWAYGSRGFHVLMLGAASIALVGGIRRSQQCVGQQGPFSFYSWPNTCDTWNLTTMGICSGGMTVN